MLDPGYVYLAAGFAGKDGMPVTNIARMHETNEDRHDNHLEKGTITTAAGMPANCVPPQ
jgi:hypothetical protein